MNLCLDIWCPVDDDNVETLDCRSLRVDLDGIISFWFGFMFSDCSSAVRVNMNVFYSHHHRASPSCHLPGWIELLRSSHSESQTPSYLSCFYQASHQSNECGCWNPLRVWSLIYNIYTVIHSRVYISSFESPITTLCCIFSDLILRYFCILTIYFKHQNELVVYFMHFHLFNTLFTYVDPICSHLYLWNAMCHSCLLFEKSLLH